MSGCRAVPPRLFRSFLLPCCVDRESRLSRQRLGLLAYSSFYSGPDGRPYGSPFGHRPPNRGSYSRTESRLRATRERESEEKEAVGATRMGSLQTWPYMVTKWKVPSETRRRLGFASVGTGLAVLAGITACHTHLPTHPTRRTDEKGANVEHRARMSGSILWNTWVLKPLPRS